MRIEVRTWVCKWLVIAQSFQLDGVRIFRDDGKHLLNDEQRLVVVAKLVCATTTDDFFPRHTIRRVSPKREKRVRCNAVIARDRVLGAIQQPRVLFPLIAGRKTVGYNNQIEQGDPSAAENLLPLVYKELRKLAVNLMRNEKPGPTLLV